MLPEITVGRGDVRDAIANGSMQSPRAASIAMASLEGAPPAVGTRFRAAFAKQALDREIAMTDPKAAHYLVRGYLSAYPAETGTALAYVYDLFDDKQRRLERVSDVLTVPGSPSDAWASVDDGALTSLASRSADDLAVALSGMPEAKVTHPSVAVAEPLPGGAH